MACSTRLTAIGMALFQFSVMVPRLAFAQACPDPKPADFVKETLIGGDKLNQPIELAVAADGKVFVAERFGDIKLYDPATGQTTTAINLVGYTFSGAFDVGGPLGVAVTPDFPAKDDWVYLYYAPKDKWNGIENHTAGKGAYRLSRMKFVAGKIEAATEQIFFDIPVEWETHNGGSLNFGKDGHLYLSTGDNSCAGCSNQYSPMDERPGYQYSDDQRSTANTNDLRGKILRIKPEASQVNGKWYSIPAGNLKEKYAHLWSAADQAKVRPEIYTMGHRNPYRVHPDPVTGRLYIGEFGPASQAASERGPAGADQFKVTDSAAFLGYPYFLKDNQAYCRWDYAAGACKAIPGQTSLKFDPARPANHSPNNTGVNILPPAKPAVLWEHDGPSQDPISGLKACGVGGGPVYHYNPSLDNKVKFPPYFTDKWIIYAMFGGWQPKLATVPAQQYAPITQAVNAPFSSGNIQFTGGLHDMEFGKDGTLYALDYGTGMYANNGSDGLFRIVYKGCLPPVIPSRIAARPRGSSSMLMIGAAAGVLAVPDGAVRAEAFDLKGEKLWQGNPDPASRTLTLPAFSGRGLVRVRWTW